MARRLAHNIVHYLLQYELYKWLTMWEGFGRSLSIRINDFHLPRFLIGLSLDVSAAMVDDWP